MKITKNKGDKWKGKSGRAATNGNWDYIFFCQKIISGSFCRQLEYIDNIGINRWLDVDEFYHELGKKQGYNEDIINNSVLNLLRYMLTLGDIVRHIDIWLVWQRKMIHGYI